jgi:hypothetical protein
MPRLWFLFAAAGSLMSLGAAPNAAADEWCLHGVYIDPADLKAYACPWGGGIVHTTHGDIVVNPGGLVVPDSAFAYGVPDDGSGDDNDSGGGDGGDDNGQ